MDKQIICDKCHHPMIMIPGDSSNNQTKVYGCENCGATKKLNDGMLCQTPKEKTDPQDRNMYPPTFTNKPNAQGCPAHSTNRYQF